MTGLSTKLIHGSDEISRVPDVVPPINISSTFRYDNDSSKLVKASELTELPESFIYSRLKHPMSQEVEECIEKVTGGYVVVYNSGLSAFCAALTLLNPKTLSIGKGYHGCHSIADIFTRNNGLKQIGLDDDFSKLGPGDLVHLETPVNPEGTNFSIKYYADKAHEKGALLMVDSTLAPPPLQDPFKFGADLVMHSATKYFGGHSDLLAGLLITKDLQTKKSLVNDRIFLGTNIGNLEASLLFRSLRTLELRVLRQTESAQKIVKYLNDNKEKFKSLKAVYHGSLQKDEYIKEQMPVGQAPIFSIELDSEETARYFPSKLKYFFHATSLGGVESLVEWRALSDPSTKPTLIRISVGLENVEDLIEDLKSALS